MNENKFNFFFRKNNHISSYNTCFTSMTFEKNITIVCEKSKNTDFIYRFFEKVVKLQLFNKYIEKTK